MLVNNNITNNVVFYLDISLEVAMKRILGRVICPKCKRTYNIFDDKLKPVKDNLCDDCNTLLDKRSDDTEETFKIRFKEYMDNTSPIINYYEDKGILKKVMANQDLSIVYENIKKEAEND